MFRYYKMSHYLEALLLLLRDCSLNELNIVKNKIDDLTAFEEPYEEIDKETYKELDKETYKGLDTYVMPERSIYDYVTEQYDDDSVYNINNYTMSKKELDEELDDIAITISNYHQCK